MAYQNSNPKSTTPITTAISGFPGNNTPEDNDQSELNPAPHGFNKAIRTKDPQTWGGK